MKILNEDFVEKVETKQETEIIDDGNDYDGYIFDLHRDKMHNYKKSHVSRRNPIKKMKRSFDKFMIAVFGKTLSNTSKKKKRKIKKILKRTAVVVLSLVLVICISVFTVLKIGESKLHNSTAPITESNIVIDGKQVSNNGESIFYNGIKYKYNPDMTTVLIAGIDKESIESETNVVGTAGQADMILLAAMDTKSGKIKTFSVSRDTMTDINVYNENGQFAGIQKLQICLSYAYGNGKETSCENLIRAVSNLFYGININSYIVLDLNSIALMNDALDGVTVIIPHDMTLDGQKYSKGQMLTLRGQNAMYFVRSRNTEELESNNDRMARQKIYLDAFINRFLTKTKSYYGTPSMIYDTLKSNMVTNLDFSSLSYLALKMYQKGATNLNLVQVPGNVKAGDTYAEFYVNEKEFFEMVLDTYYIRQN